MGKDGRCGVRNVWVLPGTTLQLLRFLLVLLMHRKMFGKAELYGLYLGFNFNFVGPSKVVAYGSSG